MSYLVYQILKMKDFLIWAGLAGLVLMIVFLLWAVRPKRGPSHYGAQAFFFRRRAWDIVYLNGTILQLLFVLSSVFGQVTIERVHLYLAASFCIIKLMGKPAWVPVLWDVGYTIFMPAVLLVCNLFAGFMGQTGTDFWILSMYGLLNLFSIELSVYYFLKCIQHMTAEPEKNKKAGLQSFVIKIGHGQKKAAQEGEAYAE